MNFRIYCLVASLWRVFVWSKLKCALNCVRYACKKVQLISFLASLYYTCRSFDVYPLSNLYEFSFHNEINTFWLVILALKFCLIFLQSLQTYMYFSWFLFGTSSTWKFQGKNNKNIVRLYATKKPQIEKTVYSSALWV